MVVARVAALTWPCQDLLTGLHAGFSAGRPVPYAGAWYHNSRFKYRRLSRSRLLVLLGKAWDDVAIASELHEVMRQPWPGHLLRRDRSPLLGAHAGLPSTPCLLNGMVRRLLSWLTGCSTQPRRKRSNTSLRFCCGERFRPTGFSSFVPKKVSVL